MGEWKWHLIFAPHFALPHQLHLERSAPALFVATDWVEEWRRFGAAEEAP
jgi:hypothetical protein